MALKYSSPILSALNGGWTPHVKHHFPEFHEYRDETSLTPEGISALNDRFVMPPTSGTSVLDDLHPGYMDIEKIAGVLCKGPTICRHSGFPG